MEIDLTRDELQMLIEALEDCMSNGEVDTASHLHLHSRLFDAYDDEEGEDDA